MPAGIVWDGGGDNLRWNDPVNWSGDQLPGPGDSVLVLAQDWAILVQTPVQVEDLTLAGSGGLNGPGDVTVSGNFDWSSGVLAGPGSLILEGSSHIGASIPELTVWGRSIHNYGGLTWDLGNLELGGGAQFVNHPSALLSFVGSQNLLSDPAGANTESLVNLGNITKSGGNTVLAAKFVNAGRVDVFGGILELQENSWQGGVIDVAQGSRFDITLGNHNLAAGATFQGSGTVKLRAKLPGPAFIVNVTLDPGATVTNSANFILDRHVFLRGSGIATGAAHFDNHGTFRWQDGTIQDLLVTNKGAGPNNTVPLFEFATTAIKSLDSSILTNIGKAVWRSGDIVLQTFSSDATIRNLGRFEIESDNQIGPGQGNHTAAFINDVEPGEGLTGLVVKTGGDPVFGVTSFFIPLVNYGTVNSAQYNLWLLYGELGPGEWLGDPPPPPGGASDRTAVWSNE